MNFCLQCGTALPQIVINLQNDPPPTQIYNENPTNPSRPRETEANNRAGFTPNYQVQSPPPPQKPRSNKKLFLILGGVFAMLFLLIIGGVAIVAYSILKDPKIANNNTATPTPANRRISVNPSPVTTNSPVITTNSTVPPALNLPAGAKAVFNKTWVDYNVTENGRTGMRIHNKFSVLKMKGIECYLAVYVQKEDGTHLTSEDTSFRSTNGNLALFQLLKPNFDNTVYEDIDLFMPYGEISVPAGKHNLKLDVDLITKDGQLIQHMNLHNFQYERLSD